MTEMRNGGEWVCVVNLMKENRWIMSYEEAVMVRVEGVQVGDTWRNWMEMARGLLLIDPDSTTPLTVNMRAAIESRIANLFEYEVDGRQIRVTKKYEVTEEMVEEIFSRERNREAELDKVLTNALLTAAEDTSKLSKRLPSDSPKLGQPVREYVDSLKGTDREIITLQLTVMQLIEVLGVACYPEELQLELQRQVECKDIQSEAEQRFLNSYVQAKVFNKCKRVVESFLTRMERKFCIVYHKGFLFEYSGKLRNKWETPSIEETVLLMEAKGKICKQLGCTNEADVRTKISFKEYKRLVVKELAPLGVTNYCSIYQVAFQRGTLASFMGRSVRDLPKDKGKLLQEFMVSFYKSDKKYMEKQEKLWGLVSKETYQKAINAVEFSEIVEEGIDVNEIGIAESFSCSLVREGFAEKNKPLYQEYLK